MLKEKLACKKFLLLNADSYLKSVINSITSCSKSLSTIHYVGSVKLSHVSSLEEFKLVFREKKIKNKTNYENHNPNIQNEGLLLPLFSKIHSQSPSCLRNK